MKKQIIIASLGALLLMVLTACSVANRSYSYSLNEQDSAVINSLFDDAQTYCLGRYTFNYPKALTQELSSMIKIDDMTIESQFIYPPSFKQRIELWEEELKKQRVSDESDGPFLKDILRLDNGVIFERNESYAYPDAARELEAHVYIDNVAFIITTKFTDITKDKYKKRQIRYQKNNRLFTDKPQKLAAMRSLISRLHGRPKNEIPTEKGICIPYGFIQDDGNPHQEEISMVFENPQFYWAVDMDNTIESEKESMLDRADEIKSVLSQYGGKTLRKGKTQLNNVAGEEWLTLGRDPRYDNQSDKFYYFQYYANEKNIGYLHPSVSILMHSSSKVVHYSDEQMVEIWDR
ncbi:T6SS immunity protein Tli4 family protein, partial [Providencia rustigianii]|uniref:T6SS immunity protein Tli4 family protein n=1 Tax=Providencia rustigianii TaxID=158850 RepID=UPI00223EC50D